MSCTWKIVSEISNIKPSILCTILCMTLQSNLVTLSYTDPFSYPIQSEWRQPGICYTLAFYVTFLHNIVLPCESYVSYDSYEPMLYRHSYNNEAGPHRADSLSMTDCFCTCTAVYIMLHLCFCRKLSYCPIYSKKCEITTPTLKYLNNFCFSVSPEKFPSFLKNWQNHEDKWWTQLERLLKYVIHERRFSLHLLFVVDLQYYE